jgi:cyclopropane-fatty-acyl-phospholipid synthase
MAVHHDERPTRRQRTSVVAVAPQGQDAVATVAERMAPLLAQLFGGAIPVRFVFWDGSALGPEDGPGRVVLRSVRVLTRLIWSPDELGMARSFVEVDIDFDGRLFDLLEALHDAVGGTGRFGAREQASALSAAVRLGAIRLPPPRPEEEVRLTGWRHSPSRDAAAIKHHYDVGNDFYQLVLGPSMTYSCARFEREGVPLEEAQTSKHDLICRKLGLHERPATRLLDVGCGWGSMAVYAAERYGAHVVAVTLSSSQAEFARARVAESGLGGLVEVRQKDYRELSGETFDAISSIGMFEHVGAKRMDEYFRTLYSLLAPQGRLLNHAISTAGGSKMKGRSFINRFVFPDGELIDVADVIGAMERAGFEMRDVESLREHYATTLQAWITNLENSWGEAVGLVGDARARIWRLYMAASANGFKEGGLALHQVLGVRATGQGESGMPATRGSWS